MHQSYQACFSRTALAPYQPVQRSCRQTIIRDLQVEVVDPILIYYDNISSIQLAKNLVFHARTKHIEVHYHFVCECILSGEVELQYVQTYQQVADIFTRVRGLDKLQQFLEMLRLQHLRYACLHLRGRTNIGRSEESNNNGADESKQAKQESGRSDSDEPNQEEAKGVKGQPKWESRMKERRRSKKGREKTFKQSRADKVDPQLELDGGC